MYFMIYQMHPNFNGEYLKKKNEKEKKLETFVISKDFVFCFDLYRNLVCEYADMNDTVIILRLFHKLKSLLNKRKKNKILS